MRSARAAAWPELSVTDAQHPRAASSLGREGHQVRAASSDLLGTACGTAIAAPCGLPDGRLRRRPERDRGVAVGLAGQYRAFPHRSVWSNLRDALLRPLNADLFMVCVMRRFARSRARSRTACTDLARRGASGRLARRARRLEDQCGRLGRHRLRPAGGAAQPERELPRHVLHRRVRHPPPLADPPHPSG